MEHSKPVVPPIRFGVFEVDRRAGELRKQGYRVKLQDQPFQLLVMLLDRPGEVVTREELQKSLWPADTFVDFERGLNRAINKLREALGDDADSPRFVETIPRRGYRLLAPVEIHVKREGEIGKNRLLLVESDPVPAPSIPAAARLPLVLSWVVAGVLAIVAVFGYWSSWHARRPLQSQPLLQFDLNIGLDEFSQPAISSDGTRVVFVSGGALAIRRFDQTKTTRLAGTEGAFLPFFSPDAHWVGFFVGDRLQKIALDGGSPVTLCHAASPGGGAWGDDGFVIAALDANKEGLSRIPEAGGVPQLLTDSKAEPSGGVLHVWPQVLPGSKGVLFAATNGSGHGSLRVFTSSDRKVRTLVENATDGRYLPSGYLLYYQRETLFGVPMDPKRLELTGPAVPLVFGVANPGGFGRAEFDISSTGTLVYRSGSVGNSFVLSWLYPSGQTEPVLRAPGHFLTPRLSPDGTRLAIALVEEGHQNLWVYDLRRATWTRLTSGAGPELLPTWTPDGEFVAFRSENTLAWTRADGSGNVAHMPGVGANAGPWSFSADGKWLAFWPLQPDSDLWTVEVERTPGALSLKRPQLFLQQAGSKGAPAISPDSRWMAYSSNESGRFEIYVVPFSSTRRAVGGKWPVSNGGGLSPMWSQKGRELFFQSLDRQVEVASYTTEGEAFVAEKPRIWSPTRLGGTGIMHAFDVAPDGKRVLALLDSEDAKAQAALHVMLHVEDELRRRTAAPHN